MLLERLGEKEKSIKEGHFGSDLPSVQALSRKHEAFQKDLAPIDETVKNLDERHVALMQTHAEQTDEIEVSLD